MRQRALARVSNKLPLFASCIVLEAFSLPARGFRHQAQQILSDSLEPHGLQHARITCPSPSPKVCSNSCPLSWWCYPTISFSATPFSFCFQFFPASEYFPVGLLFASGNQSIRASVSVLPVNIQDWSPLGWIGWISLQSKWLLRVFSNTTVQKHQFFWCSAFFTVQLTSIHNHWKNHSLDQTDLCWQSNVSAFYYFFNFFLFFNLFLLVGG